MHRLSLVGAAIVVLVVFPSLQVGADDLGITFMVTVVSTERSGREPVISYGLDGSVWVAGSTNFTVADGNLWNATTDAGPFTLQEPPPPPSGGFDATAHNDTRGRLFYTEVGQTVEKVSVLQNGVWTTYDFPKMDRPWLRTDSFGFTYLVSTNLTVDGNLVEIRRYNPETALWSIPFTIKSGGFSGIGFVNDTSDILYVAFWPSNDHKNISVAYQASSSYNSPWSFTPKFELKQNAEGLPPLAVDFSGKVYVVFYDNIDGQHSLWARHFNGTSWSVPHRLCLQDVTCAFPGAVAGTTGRVGVVWYEADGNFFPPTADPNTVWRVRYGLFENMHGTPSATERVTIMNNVNRGVLSIAQVLDFSYATRRMTDASGRVSVAFNCLVDNGSCPGNGLSVPVLAGQLTGPGLLT